MNEIIKIIEGYNSEKDILTKAVTTEDVIKNYCYDNRKTFVADSRKRIEEIDKKINDIISKLLKTELK